MEINSTQKIPWFLGVLFLGMLQFVTPLNAFAQNQLPSYTIDLTGKPNGTWTSEEVQRGGSVCGENNCVLFTITLDKNAAGLELELLSGSEPKGSMFYKLDCGELVPVGQPICVTGTGPFRISLCKPGNNRNVYQVKSIAAFEPQPDISVTSGCSAVLKAPIAFEEESIIWRDITGGGAYDKYLSFPNGKSAAVITPDDNAPAFVDYEVCGRSVASPCSTLPYCDVVRVFFYKAPVVTIGPEPAIICPGGSGVVLTGTVTGGDGAFDYIWTNASNQRVGGNQPTYTATAIGTYKLAVVPRNSSNCREFSATVNVVNNLSANAGPDQLVCSQSTVQLAGAVTAATGGIWSGGSGTFSSKTALNAVYTPSAADISAGSVRLTLTSTGNGSCNPVKDEVLITFYNMNVTLTGTSAVCNGTLGNVSASVSGAQAPVTYRWNTGETTAAISNKAAGTYTVTVSDGKGCSVAKSFTIAAVTGPTGFTASVKNPSCGISNGSITVSGATGGTAPYTYSKDGTTFQSGTTFSNLAPGSHTITVKDANGCTFARAYTLTNTAGPTAVSATAQAASCANNDGRITVGAVTGGTSSYTYSINGTAFQSSTTFTGLASGAYTVTAKDANGCTVTTSVTVASTAPTGFTATATASTCGGSNGSVAVSSVVGGTAPYTYSKNGTTFQSSANLTGLAAGTHTITVKDANGCTFAKQVVVTDVAGPTNMTATLKPATCGASNGEITVTGTTGGASGYTYSKDGVNFQASTSFTGLAAGTHTITVKDAKGCTFAKAFTVANAAGPTAAAATAQPAGCANNDGGITVGTVTGGTAPYTYSLNGTTFQSGTSFTGLASGPYTLTVKDANGCTMTTSVAVGKTTPTGFTATATTASCGGSNGSVAVSSVVGGTAPYTYSKNGTTFQSSANLTGLAAGTHTITVKDAKGCTFAKEVVIGDVAGPSNFNLTSNSSSCGNSNGSVTVGTVTGGTSPYTYSKDGTTFQAATTLTGLAAGNHTITVKDARGCTITKQATVANIAGPTEMAATPKSSTCGASNGELAITGATGGTAPYTYSKDGVNFQASATFTGLAAGSHSITVKDAKGCTFAKAFTVGNIGGATAVAASSQPATCANNDGGITVGTVTGGTAPYTYSINGTTFQSGTTFTGLASGAYTVTAKDASGCNVTTSVTVGKNVPTDFANSTAPSSCGRSDGSITVGTVTGGTAPYTYSINGTTFQASTAFSGLAAGAHTITVKDAKGCTFAKEVSISNVAGPVFTAAAQAATCSASNGRVTVSGVTGGVGPYTYSKDGTSFQASTAFANLAPGNYTITVKDANGCLGTRSVVIEDKAGPSGLKLASAASTCGKSNATISVSEVTGGTAPYTYSSNGTTFQASATLTGLAAGTHTITVKDANGCTFAKAIVVENVAGPSAMTLTSTSATCGTANGSISITGVTGGTAPYTYSANGTSFQSATKFEAVSAGTRTITVKDANGCTITKEVTVANIAGPTDIAATTKGASCGTSDGGITITGTTGGTAPYSYSKDGTTFQASTTFTGLAAGAHSITVKDANGCTFAKPFSVSSIGGPSAVTASTQPASCTVNDGTITVGQVTGGKAPYTYSLGGATYQASSTFAGLAAGEYEVYARDANGCSTSATVKVGSKGPQEAAIASTQAACGESNGAITVTSVTGGTKPYSYSINGGGFQASATFANLAVGTYQVTIKDAEGCTFTQSQNVVNSGGVETFTVTGTDASCGENNGRIAISQVAGGQSPYTYSIDGTTFKSEPTFTGLAEGTYQVTVKDGRGCSNIKTVTLENSPMLTDVKFSVSVAGCGQGAGAVVIEEVSGGTSPYAYSLDGTNFSSATTLGNVAPGTYTLIVKDAKGCTFSVPVTVASFDSKLAFVQNISCFGETNGAIAISATGKDANTEYSIDNGASFQKDSVFSNLPKGTYQVMTRFSASCTVTLGTVEIKEPAVLQVTVTPTAGSIAQPNSAGAAVTAISGGTAPYFYQLDNGQFTADSVFTGLRGGEHTLVVKDANGCTTEVKFSVENLGELDIPNGFTPNGDGINDRWAIRNLSVLYPNCRVTVYNRWGSPVFESKGYTKEWDGTHNGKRLPDGTYYGIIEFGDSRPALKTSVTIMR